MQDPRELPAVATTTCAALPALGDRICAVNGISVGGHPDSKVHLDRACIRNDDLTTPASSSIFLRILVTVTFVCRAQWNAYHCPDAAQKKKSAAKIVRRRRRPTPFPSPSPAEVLPSRWAKDAETGVWTLDAFTARQVFAAFLLP